MTTVRGCAKYVKARPLEPIPYSRRSSSDDLPLKSYIFYQ
jgi:hypothetical protein